ncbi:hypothetical protein NDA10_003432 [Ustilago hordei]|nr:hypothetical protein NDA10_003432 [Ustilago hordei]
MVCTSNKQHLLDDIETTIMHSLMVESKMQLDLMDVNATWHPNDDLEDSDDDMFDHAISFALIRTYDIISQSRYTTQHNQCLQINIKLSACSAASGSLYKLNSEVVTFATEDEHAKAKAWVADKSGVEEWSRGWLVVDGTHINLAWKPVLNAHKHYSYKGDYTFNIALVFLPHSLCIVKSVVGHPGSSHDAQVWASGSGIVAKPRLHLDEGEFVWVDAGYGYSSYTVGLYSNTAAAKSRDLHYFNYSLSHIRVKAEHGIAYLKNCFQCLMGFRGNLYQEEDHEKAAHTVQACIIAHTFASCYDRPDEVAEYLKASETLSEAEVLETMSGMEAYQQATKDARIQRRENQQQYKQEQAAAMEGMSQN